MSLFQVTKLSNGLVVASVENNSPVFRVAAVVQAGAKYEPYESRGVTTLLRVFSNLVIVKRIQILISRIF
jgi:ubiquinol-cytochrome c reductase core subunit 2